jgi:hypothetical protein
MTHWSRLKPVHGFTRVPDDSGGRRMLKCDRCGRIIPALGVGYHRGGGVHGGDCTKRKNPACGCWLVLWGQDVTVLANDGSCDTHEKAVDLLAGPGKRDGNGYLIRPVYGPPVPPKDVMDSERRARATEAHAELSVDECELATTAAGCIWHPAPMAAHVPATRRV